MKQWFKYLYPLSHYLSIILIGGGLLLLAAPVPINADSKLNPPPPVIKGTKAIALGATLNNPGFDNHDWYYDSYVPGATPAFVPSYWNIWYKDGTIPLYTRVTSAHVDGEEGVRGHAYWNGAEGLQAGLYQVINGVTPCLTYRFQMYGQSFPGESSDVLYGLRVGIHPTGYAPSNKAIKSTNFNQINWGAARTDCVGTWCLLSVTSEAQADSMTVFMYANTDARVSHDIVWDAGALEQVARTDNLIDASQPLPAPSSGIYNIVVEKATNSASISWDTGSVNTYGQVLYRVLGSGTWQYSNIHDWGTTHQIDLTGLQTGNTYEYVIVSYGYIGGACQAIVSATDQISFAPPLTGVSISGQTIGYLGQDYTFIANASPANATLPIEYVWEATGQATVTHSDSGSLQDSVTFSWDTPGVKTVKVTATNATGSVEDIHTIEIKGDGYEPDDSCAQASVIPTNGTRQAHTFHAMDDNDWVYFNAIFGFTYLIEGLTPSDSDANVSLSVYDACDGMLVASQAYTYTPDVRLPFTATATAPFYVSLSQEPSTSGTDMAYNLSVRTIPKAAASGIVVLVAGKFQDDDTLQPNIYHAADAVYQFFRDQGYDSESIYYLSTDGSNPNVDDSPTHNNLQYAITQWAISALLSKPNSTFTLYVVGHGGQGTLYLKGDTETVNTTELNNWLSSLENATIGTQVNVVIDTPFAGSFIGLEQSLSADGRIIIASTGKQQPAWATEEGVLFSDYFVSALRRGLSLYAGFQEATWSVKAVHPEQTPWLDDDGDGLANGVNDGTWAAKWGFLSFDTPGALEWPPYIASAGINEIVVGHGVITANVQDDGSVAHVWAEIYPPKYTPFSSDGEELILDTSIPTVTLTDQGGGLYRAEYGGFSTLYLGADRVVIYAVDDDGQMARPRSVGGRYSAYLPLIMKD
ncbi:MAG TPA: hypothetical protein ENF52_03675 [Chloroflexi bacterium]|nr:hypothetical protein [Chloroflexota bacterium]